MKTVIASNRKSMLIFWDGDGFDRVDFKGLSLNQVEEALNRTARRLEEVHDKEESRMKLKKKLKKLKRQSVSTGNGIIPLLIASIISGLVGQSPNWGMDR